MIKAYVFIKVVFSLLKKKIGIEKTIGKKINMLNVYAANIF
jgi:hypothetical protein